MFPHLVQRSSFRILIAITLSFSLLLLPVFFGPGSEAAPGQGVRAGKPRREKPEGELPDLEEVQRESLLEREAPGTVPFLSSTGTGLARYRAVTINTRTSRSLNRSTITQRQDLCPQR